MEFEPIILYQTKNSLGKRWNELRREKTCLGKTDQVRHKSACEVREMLEIILLEHCKTKVLIYLHGSAFVSQVCERQVFTGTGLFDEIFAAVISP